MQVLQQLSDDLVVAVLRAAPLSLEEQLRRLLEVTRHLAVHAALPSLHMRRSLSLDCVLHDAPSATFILQVGF